MTTSIWDQNQENEFKNDIKKFFDNKIKAALKESNNYLKIGDQLGTILKSSDKDVAKLIIPRAVKKWASPKTLSKWKKVIGDPRMILELRIIGRSIANTMRPLAGNTFTSWVAKILNEYFNKSKICLLALTSGKIKNKLQKSLVKKIKGQKGVRDYRPDIDIVLIRTDKNKKPVAIISTKTTLAERVMQTISWTRFLKADQNRGKKIKVFLITAWDTIEDKANRERVQELDSVYVCDRNVKEYGNIRMFSKIARHLKQLSK